MAGKCFILNPLQRDGTNQNQRLVRALHPSYVLVDERDIDDLLMYALEFAEFIRYYNSGNEQDGDWKTFIENDISTLVSMILAFDTADLRDTFNLALLQLEEEDIGTKQSGIENQFTVLFALFVQFNSWHEQSIEGLGLESSLKVRIQSVLNDALRNTISLCGAFKEGTGVDPCISDTGIFSEVWNLDNIGDSNIVEDPASLNSSEEALNELGSELKKLFEKTLQELLAVQAEGPGLLDETLEKYPEHQPYMGLFLAFLKILMVARDHMNLITRRHLDFYYQDVLKIDSYPENPDQVHLVFELAKTFESHLISKGTLFKDGKDSNSENILFAADDELVVNRAKIDEATSFKSVFIDKEYEGSSSPDHTTPYLIRNIHAAGMANSEDGEGADLEDEDGKWATLGNRLMPKAEIGFAIASPILLLQEGTRTITFTFTFDDPDDVIFADTSSHPLIEHELKRNVIVELSGEKEWIGGSINSVDINASLKQYIFEVKLDSGAEAVVNYDEKALESGFGTKYPVVRFTLDNEGLGYDVPGIGFTDGEAEMIDSAADYDKEESYNEGDYVIYEDELYRSAITSNKGYRPDVNPDQWVKVEKSYPYKYFRPLKIRKIKILVDVDEVKTLVVENDQGTINPAKPFQPFGAVPKVGSSFYIGSHEIFKKQLNELTIKVTWANLPDNSFEDYYSDYQKLDSSSTTGYSPYIEVNNEDFQARIEILEHQDWRALVTAVSLFVDQPVTTTDLAIFSEPVFHIDDIGNLRNVELETFNSIETSLKQGFIRFKLLKDFYHKDYAQAITTAALSEGKVDVPNEPFNPVISELTVDYASEQTIDYTALEKSDFEERTDQLFQVHPFGMAEIFPVDEEPDEEVNTSDILVPGFLLEEQDAGTGEAITDADGEPIVTDSEGNLFIGIEGLVPEQNLSILFQVAEGSENPEKEKQEARWYYLSYNRWVEFDHTEVLSDDTNGLIRSGIIKFIMPKNMNSDNTILPSGKFWIRAAVARDSDAICKVIAILPQALKATFSKLENSDLERLKEPLEAAKVTKMKSGHAAIKSVGQPYASFNGKVEERPASAEEVTGEDRFNKEYNEYYIRISERLRHKQRGITIFDYERLVLQQFPEVYKVKCVNHTSESCEHHPGHVTVVVIPDLRNKNAVDPLEPRLSLNTLDEISDFLKPLIPDFVTLDVKNPAYETVEASFNVKFLPGKDKGFYTNQLQEDIIKFLTPWLYDEGKDLVLGGSIHRSAVLNFIEETDYVDFLTDFKLFHTDASGVRKEVEEARASTSSSALVSGKTHSINFDINVECQT